MSATRVPDILFSPKVIIGSVGLCGPGFVHGARAGPGKAAISGATAVIITLLPRRVCEPHAMRALLCLQSMSQSPTNMPLLTIVDQHAASNCQ